MKHTLRLLLACVACLPFGSCTSLQEKMPQNPQQVITLAKPYIAPGAALIVGQVVKNTAGEERDRYVKILKVAATSLHVLSASATPPTEDEFRQTLLTLDPDNKYPELWPSIAAALTGLYTGYSASLPPEAKAAQEAAGLIADGIMQGLRQKGLAALSPINLPLHVPAGFTRIQCRGSWI